MYRSNPCLSVALSLACLCMSPSIGQAQEAWPSRPITVVVTYPAGGGSDVIARHLGPKMADILGQPVVIENRTGASGQIGAGYVARAKPDGYTVMIDTSGYVINPLLFPKLAYSTKNFTPIGIINTFPLIYVANPDFGVKSIGDLVAKAKAAPTPISYASPGTGSMQHIAGELFLQQAGARMLHVPYKGGGPAIADVMAGHVPLFVANISSTLSVIKSGKLQPLAVMSARRTPALPDVPTMAEAGIQKAEAYEWCGLFVPAGTPPAVVAKLTEALKGALASPEVRQNITAVGAEIFEGDKAESDRFIAAQTQSLAKTIRDARIEIE
ncbi:MAG: tripartite tricarboxylate transporter substrate binding protein [Comamonadaceae bacterium]|nr:MAG: tripartite tricarboxylate transporter substrate binding protein [Comamonadaceae bacterium]